VILVITVLGRPAPSIVDLELNRRGVVLSANRTSVGENAQSYQRRACAMFSPAVLIVLFPITARGANVTKIATVASSAVPEIF
jgi:hypothetical protein